MKRCLATSVLLLLGPPVLGLGRPHALLQQPRAARCCGAAPLPVMAGFSMPFGGKQPSGPAPEEMQACYRLLGVSEEADYDEVEAAFDMLYNIKYKGQVKQQIKLKVAKDKIYEERLRQRMSGTLKPVRESSPFDREVKKEFRLPSFMDGIAELPTREYFLRNAAVFAAIGLIPLVVRSFAGNAITVALGVAIYKLYNRGAPESSGMEAEMRPPKVGVAPRSYSL